MRGLLYRSLSRVFGALLLLFLFGTFMERTRGVRFRAGWCCGVVGLRGGGKSLFVLALIARRLEQGVPVVVANFSVPGCVSYGVVGGRDLARRRVPWSCSTKLTSGRELQAGKCRTRWLIGMCRTRGSSIMSCGGSLSMSRKCPGSSGTKQRIRVV